MLREKNCENLEFVFSEFVAGSHGQDNQHGMFLEDISRKNAPLQLNEYETAPDFLQLSQNMTSDCLFTFVFFPVLT